MTILIITSCKHWRSILIKGTMSRFSKNPKVINTARSKSSRSFAGINFVFAAVLQNADPAPDPNDPHHFAGSGSIIFSMDPDPYLDPDPDHNLALFHHLSHPHLHFIFHSSSLTPTPSSIIPCPFSLISRTSSLTTPPSPHLPHHTSFTPPTSHLIPHP